MTKWKPATLSMTFMLKNAKNIGITNKTQINANHPSIEMINKTHALNPGFSFDLVTEKHVNKLLKALDTKKATGIGSSPPNIY